MDTSDPEITFDGHGVCNHCRRAEGRLAREHFAGPQHAGRLEALLDTIRAAGKGKPYDCLVGVSGGVDSSYVAYLAKQWGLRPLALHFDNGWNSELSVQNIEVLLNKLGIDLQTFVMDWDEFKDLQLSFLKASVANCEIPTDHAITALQYRVAAKHGIRFILGGANLATESIMPRAWMHKHIDLKFLKAIHQQFGARPLRQFPMLGPAGILFNTFVRKIRYVTPLNYIHYDKEATIGTLERELGWRRYEGKHFESIYTRWFQGYLLPVKFGIDKRRPHFSSLIVSGQMSRADALAGLQGNAYLDGQAAEDQVYVAKKLGLGAEQFAEILRTPPRPSSDFPSHAEAFDRFQPLIAKVKRIATMRG